MAKFKRKGLTFVTEHYLPQKTLDALVIALQAHIRREIQLYEQKPNKTNRFSSPSTMFANLDEISVWADPRGFFMTTGRSLPKTPVEWYKLDIDTPTILAILEGLIDAFKEHGQECSGAFHFRVVLNEGTLHKITQIFLL